MVEKLDRAADRLGIGVLGFHDMSVERVARECGLTLLEARLAKLREYGEAFRLLCSNPVAERRLVRALESAGLTCRLGTPFHCVAETAGPRSAIDVLTTMYRLAFGRVVTAARDEGHARTDIIPFVDLPFERLTPAASAREWLDTLVQQVQFCRDAQVAFRAARQAR